MIWVIAGTKESRDIIYGLLGAGFYVTATVISEYGVNLLGSHENLTVVQRAMTSEEMTDFLNQYKIRLVADASHPYAVETSLNAIAAARYKNIPYIRYERNSAVFDNVREFDSYEDAAGYLYEKSGNILLTIGSRNLDKFSELIKRLYVKILPVKDSISSCEKAGIPTQRIFCMHFPFSSEFHKQLYRELDIRFLVTKESGEQGWTNEKVEAAVECGIEVLMIKRPRVDYPEVYYSADETIRRIDELMTDESKN